MKIRFGLAAAVLLFCASLAPAQESKKTQHVTGRVTAVSGDSITVKSGANTMTFAVDASTKVTGKGVDDKKGKSTITDLVGEYDSVVVDYEDLGGGKLHATRIDVRAKRETRR